MKKFIPFFILFMLSQIIVSCGIYSFTGTTALDAESISIYLIENRAMRVNPSLSNTLTEALKDKYKKFTKLNQLVDGGDLMVEGQITSYEVTAMAITANEVASQNRLTVTVKIMFTDNKNDKNSFEKNFVAYKDFPSAKSFDSVESTLLEPIIEQLVEDIFNGTVANW